MVLSGSTLTKIVQSSVGNLRVVFVHCLVLILYVVRDRSLFRGGGSIIFKRGKRGAHNASILRSFVIQSSVQSKAGEPRGLAKNMPHKGEGQETLNMVCPHLH